MKKIKFYTFQDIINWMSDNVSIGSPYPERPHQEDVSDWFTAFLDGSLLQYRIVGFKVGSTIITSNMIQGYINDLINIVYNRHAYDFIASNEKSFLEDFNEDDDEEAVEEALTKIINMINNTAPKYIPLMYQYVQNYENPFKMLESISESFNRFNDTPQNVQDEVDFNTEQYATTMGKSKNVSQVDSASVLTHLEELKDKFRSVILDWSNEFNRLFISELQLGD